MYIKKLQLIILSISHRIYKPCGGVSLLPSMLNELICSHRESKWTVKYRITDSTSIIWLILLNDVVMMFSFCVTLIPKWFYSHRLLTVLLLCHSSKRSLPKRLFIVLWQRYSLPTQAGLSDPRYRILCWKLFNYDCHYLPRQSNSVVLSCRPRLSHDHQLYERIDQNWTLNYDL